MRDSGRKIVVASMKKAKLQGMFYLKIWKRKLQVKFSFRSAADFATERISLANL